MNGDLADVTVMESPDEDPYEVEDRRRTVQRLKLRGQTVKAIAAVATAVMGRHVAIQTVVADLEWLRVNNLKLYGNPAAIDPAQEIGAALADYEAMGEAAWMEFHQLKQEAAQRRLSPMFVARARANWLRTAAMMRMLRVKTLAEHGLMNPPASSMTPVGGGVGRADEIRAMLRTEGLGHLLDAGSEVTKAVMADD